MTLAMNLQQPPVSKILNYDRSDEHLKATGGLTLSGMSTMAIVLRPRAILLARCCNLAPQLVRRATSRTKPGAQPGPATGSPVLCGAAGSRTPAPRRSNVDA